ncbi:MAG: acyltransferase, partial [Pseudomonadota bacterium]
MNSNKIRPTSGNETHLAYRAEIDGLRALAVIPVILFHAGFEWFKGGFVGVDVFFVISGYLITGIIIKQKEAGTFSLVDFYVRRARRILPALFFVMLVCVPIAWMWMAPFQLKRFAWSLASVSLFSSNFLFARTTGYFDPSVEEIPLLHTWSLGVEEQYYVIFPPLVIVLWRLGIKKLAWVTVLVALLSLAYSEWGWRNHPTVNFYFTPTRAWELLLGSLLAYASFGKPLHERVAPVVSDLASAAGLLLVVGAILAVLSVAIPVN